MRSSIVFMRKIRFLLGLFCGCWMACSASAQSLVWSNTLAEARPAAIDQGKLILLMAGKPGCDYCDYMELTVCETPSVRTVIDEVYVPWNSNMDLHDDYMPYEAGMPEVYSLPLICMVDPYTTNVWLKRTWSLSTTANFTAMLKEAAALAPPRPANLVHGQVVATNQYQVLGHIWTNAQTTNVYYRAYAGSSSSTPFRSASGISDWSASLAPFIVSGVSNQYTFETYAKASVKYPSKTVEVTSGTNQVVFIYDPQAAVISRPGIRSIKVAAAVQLSLTNLTAGAASRVERSLNISNTNGWTAITNFVSSGTTREVFDQVGNGWNGAFYRVSITP